MGGGPPLRDQRRDDSISGVTTRWSNYPYTTERVYPGARHPFSWRRPTVVDHPREPLPDVINDMIQFWREPSRDPRAAFTWRYDLQRMAYDVTDVPRSRCR
ncbi:hypothetical protein Psuf_072480 [Phytohabitans suffuscus]|uniref:Uncharacterized protein n=1 Tax=Phytohabitans suffuscus TaxID=624315 RepID=A0A6F8YUT2_9ACTN|nr:hypothetical protein [Phytohabitans suffuscus]BCB89935.1 hypothetical protein Psuf_072480 [Phytohabitans suffuscus]